MTSFNGKTVNFSPDLWPEIIGVLDGGAGMLKLFNGWPLCFAISTGIPGAYGILLSKLNGR
jgi:hypothetical protein